MKEKIIIIGSGFGALGAAARLAARGYQVEIFEKQDKPGGRAYVFEQDGFKFDGGPTVITCLLYTSPSPRDPTRSRMPPSA